MICEREQLDTAELCRESAVVIKSFNRLDVVDMIKIENKGFSFYVMLETIRGCYALLQYQYENVFSTKR